MYSLTYVCGVKTSKQIHSRPCSRQDKVNMSNDALAESGSEIVASDCWPSAELQAARVICHVWSSVSAASTTVGDTHHGSSSFSLAGDETNFRNALQCASLQTSWTHLTERTLPGAGQEHDGHLAFQPAAILVPQRTTTAKLMTSEALSNWSEFITAQLSSTEITCDTGILVKTTVFQMWGWT